jgi:hypothetical protein
VEYSSAASAIAYIFQPPEKLSSGWFCISFVEAEAGHPGSARW